MFKDQITVLFYFYFKPLKFQKFVKFGCKIYFSIKKVNNFTIQKFGNQKIPDWFHLSPEELKKKKETDLPGTTVNSFYDKTIALILTLF